MATKIKEVLFYLVTVACTLCALGYMFKNADQILQDTDKKILQKVGKEGSSIRHIVKRGDVYEVVIDGVKMKVEL